METYIDSKKEVDSHLKKTCEEFIHSITQTFVGPLVNFLTKVCHSLMAFVDVQSVLEKVIPRSFEQHTVVMFIIKYFQRETV